MKNYEFLSVMRSNYNILHLGKQNVISRRDYVTY